VGNLKIERSKKDMTELKKFLFDTNDFSPEAIQAAANSFTEEEYAQAKAESYEQGKNEGIQETRKQQEEKIIQSLKKATSTIDALINQENRREVEKLSQALEISMRVIKKVLPTLNEKVGVDEVEKAIKETLGYKKEEARINLYVPKEYFEYLDKRIKETISQNNYSSQINIIADEKLGPVDFRAEWVNGGIEKNFQDLMEKVEREFKISGKGLEIEAKKAEKLPNPDIFANITEVKAENIAPIQPEAVVTTEQIEQKTE